MMVFGGAHVNHSVRDLSPDQKSVKTEMPPGPQEPELNIRIGPVVSNCRGVVSGEPKKKPGAADVSGSGAARLLSCRSGDPDGAAIDGFADGRLGFGLGNRLRLGSNCSG